MHKGLRDFRWVEESSTDGVAVIRSSTHSLMIVYDPTDEEQSRLIAALMTKVSNKQNTNAQKSLRNSLSNTSLDSTSIPGNYSIADLINSINRGDDTNAKKIASELAKQRIAAHLVVSEKEQIEQNDYIRFIS